MTHLMTITCTCNEI